MKSLPLELRKNGYDYEQLKRCETAAIYRQTYEGKLVSFEVFEIKVRPASVAFGREFPAHEAFPSNEDFGKTAFTVFNIVRACHRYDGIIEKVKNRKTHLAH